MHHFAFQLFHPAKLCYTINMNGKQIYDVIIVGAGASGMLCALECARRGKQVLLIEKEPIPGRKILASGNGRCNLTNRHVRPAYYHGDPVLLTKVFAQFSFENCRNYFETLGVVLTEENQGRFFPATGKSTAVVEPLKIALQETGAQLLLGEEVIRIRHKQDFTVTTKSGKNFSAHYLVLACGSCAYPQLSGTQSGYMLAKELGLTVNPPKPALSALCIKEKALSRLAGIRSQVLLQVWKNGQAIDQAEGEVLFTNYGISGPAALNVSSSISQELVHGNVPITLNFFPAIHPFQPFLENRLHQFATRKPKDFLAGLLHENIANLLIDFVGLRKNLPMQQQLPQAIQKIGNTLTQWPLSVISLRPWSESMVACGGVKTSEINYNTFESLRCKKLYITGELLDVNGKSGGFNLHFAWASGLIAARHLSAKE